MASASCPWPPGVPRRIPNLCAEGLEGEGRGGCGERIGGFGLRLRHATCRETSELQAAVSKDRGVFWGVERGLTPADRTHGETTYLLEHKHTQTWGRLPGHFENWTQSPTWPGSPIPRLLLSSGAT